MVAVGEAAGEDAVGVVVGVAAVVGADPGSGGSVVLFSHPGSLRPGFLCASAGFCDSTAGFFRVSPGVLLGSIGQLRRLAGSEMLCWRLHLPAEPAWTGGVTLLLPHQHRACRWAGRLRRPIDRGVARRGHVLTFSLVRRDRER
jgi:hypothetical protein